MPASTPAEDDRPESARATTPTAWSSILPGSDEPAGAPLALAFALRQRSTFAPGRWQPRRTEPVTPRALAHRQDELSLAVRPLMRGARGGWIKGDASWDAVRRTWGALDRTQARWFADLHTVASRSSSLSLQASPPEWLVLDDAASPLVWAQLAAADALGIPFVTATRHQTVRLAGSGSASVRISPAPDGGLRLAAAVEIDGLPVDPDLTRPLGPGGLYTFTLDTDPIRLVLAPATLDDAVRPLLLRGAVAVPPGETAAFWDEAYPRLARRATVVATGGVSLPAAPHPTATLEAWFSGGDRVEYELGWRYGALGRFPYRTDAVPPRDAEAERELRARIDAAWAEATDVPFAPRGVLTGIDTAEFAARVLPALDALADVTVETHGRRPAYREIAGEPEITVSTVESTDPDWFDLGVIVKIDGRSIPFQKLFTALTLGKRRLLLADGAYFSLRHPALARLRELIDEAGEVDEWETGPRISRYQLALWPDFEDLADEALPAVSWRATAAGLRDVERVDPTPVPAGLRAELRPYQRAGFDWLAFLWRHRLGGILADDMGLGKTLQMLTLLTHAVEEGEERPFLVVVPTSVLSTWKTEAARFAPDLRLAIVDATSAKRAVSVADAAKTAHVVVTTYTLLRLDAREFERVQWAGVVLDEAQFVKNARTRAHRIVKELQADAVFAVTGTPLENSLSELWALLSLTAPGLFASERRFREEYIKPIEHGKVPENQDGGAFRAGRLDRLRRRIRPLVLRRTKESVAPELPPTQEQELRVELSPAHRALYDVVLQRERQKVLGLLDDLDRQRFIVFRSLTLLRMLSLAPGLIDQADAGIPSAKLTVLLDHLRELAAEGHRALVFSQFTSFLQLAAERLDAAGIAYAYLDGSTRRREAVIEGFRAGDAPVFLISLKAGGFGLTLTEADYVFLLDPWWNPAAEAQAIDRTHRIGQRSTVMVYRLIAEDTIEQKVMALQQRKARLFQAVVDDSEPFSGSLTADDIRSLLDG